MARHRLYHTELMARHKLYHTEVMARHKLYNTELMATFDRPPVVHRLQSSCEPFEDLRGHNGRGRKKRMGNTKTLGFHKAY